jgi:PhnB protein
MTVKPIPEGYTSLTPFLCIDGAAAAIDVYVSVFGADLVDRMDGPGGTVAHAELDFGNGEPAQTFVTRDRFASIVDPFGQRWTVMTRVEDVSPEERDRRMAQWAKENA